MKKIIILIVTVLFSFNVLVAQDSKAELDSLKRDVDSLKNELEILKLKRDMDKLQSELDTLKSSAPKAAEPAAEVVPATVISTNNLYPFKKNIFSINFAYSLYGITAAALMDNHYNIMKDHELDYPKYIIEGTTSLDFYGVNLSSERMLKTNISFAMEYGWNGGSVYFADSSMSELKADFQIIPVALGVKIYTKKHSPYGFFMYPKIGATILQAEGTIISRTQYIEGEPASSGRHHGGAPLKDLYYDSALASETNSINIDFDYGIYASVEFGFRIPLFRKALSKKKMELGIDISLLDIGYYIKPYHENTVKQLSKMNVLNEIADSEYDQYYRIRFMPLPRFGLTFRF